MRSLLTKLAVFGITAAFVCLFYGFFIEPKSLKVRYIDFKETRWTGAPLTIALISDIHIGGWHVNADRVSRIVEEINAQSPDIVLIAGDFVDGHDKASDRSNAFNSEIAEGIHELTNLTTPLGTYAVIGNHDDWYDGTQIEKLLTRANTTVLENDHKIIQTENSNFCLVGLPDSWTGKFDPVVFKGCGQHQKIVLMHSPDSFKNLPNDTVLALSGHTHGGQINLPLIGRRVTATAIGPDFAYGKLLYRNIPVFVTAGIGTSMLPARFSSPPEIVIIRISKALDDTSK